LKSSKTRVIHRHSVLFKTNTDEIKVAEKICPLVERETISENHNTAPLIRVSFIIPSRDYLISGSYREAGGGGE
jgi:hypothetical protein